MQPSGRPAQARVCVNASKFESKFALTLNNQHDFTRFNTKAFATLMQPSGRPAQACVCVNASKFVSKFALTKLIINTMTHD